MKNKVAQALSLLLVQTYSLPPPYTLLSTLLALTRGSDASLNPTSTDLVLRILHDLSLTLGSDVTLRAVRSRERLARDGAVRDEIRTHNAPAVAEAVWGIVEESMGRVGTGVWPGKMAEEITELAVRVVGDYVCECSCGGVLEDDLLMHSLTLTQLGPTSPSWSRQQQYRSSLRYYSTPSLHCGSSLPTVCWK